MKKVRFPMTLTIGLGTILLLCSACTQTDSTPQSVTSQSSAPQSVASQPSAAPSSAASASSNGAATQLVFPESDAEKTDYNKAVFEITPFKIQVALPDGWSVGKFDQNQPYAMNGVWSRVGIYDEKGNCVGAAGYNTFELGEGIDEQSKPMAIYNQIAMGNDYQFNVRDSYTVVNQSDSGETATVDVYHSAVLSSDSASDAKANYGILSYNSKKSVYVAFELDSSIPKDTVASIANSLQFVD